MLPCCAIAPRAKNINDMTARVREMINVYTDTRPVNIRIRPHAKKPMEMVRTQEDVYKKQFKGKNFTDEEWIKIMVETPKLIQRPIVVKGYKAVWGDPADEIDRLF